MPFSFSDDPSQFADSEEAAEQVVQQLEQQEQEAAFDDQLSEVEQRLEIASYYRLLLNDHLFGDMTPAAVEVEKEVRGFIRNRLEVLLGIKQETAPAKDVFTEAEVSALKTVASKILRKPELAEPVKAAPPPAPSLRQVAAPAAKAPPALKKTAPAPKQVVRKAETASRPAPKPEPKKEAKANSEPEQVSGRIKKRYKQIVAPDGRTVEIDVTPQGTSPVSKPVPMPTGAQLTQLSNSQAHQQLANLAVDPLVDVLTKHLVSGE